MFCRPGSQRRTTVKRKLTGNQIDRGGFWRTALASHLAARSTATNPSSATRTLSSRNPIEMCFPWNASVVSPAARPLPWPGHGLAERCPRVPRFLILADDPLPNSPNPPCVLLLRRVAEKIGALQRSFLRGCFTNPLSPLVHAPFNIFFGGGGWKRILDKIQLRPCSTKILKV